VHRRRFTVGRTLLRAVRKEKAPEKEVAWQKIATLPEVLRYLDRVVRLRRLDHFLRRFQFTACSIAKGDPFGCCRLCELFQQRLGWIVSCDSRI